MFGYVRAHKSEMRMKDYEAYRGVYCTLCRRLGKSFGPLARFTLNYDFTFLAVLMLAMSEECPRMKPGRCVFNPLVRCASCTGGKEPIDRSAAIAMCMLYYKLKDDLEDRGFFRSFPTRLIYPLFASARKKAAALVPEADEVMREMVHRQRQVEQSQDPSLDSAAEPTAWALSQIFTLEVAPEKGEAQRRVLERLGYCLGRWIYLVDALQDMEKDRKHGEFNPYLSRVSVDFSDPDALIQAKKEWLPGLNVCISEVCAAFELLEIHHFREILHNIVYYGLEQVQTSVANGTWNKKRKGDLDEKSV